MNAEPVAEPRARAKSHRPLRAARAAIPSVAIAAVLAAAAPAGGQDDARLGVALTALEHVRASLPAGRVVLDPRAVCDATIAGWACPEPMADRVRTMNLELGSRDFNYVCRSRSRGCEVVGTDVLVQLGEPRIMGNTASVVVNVWWRTGHEARPVGSRRSELHLQRRRGVWRVVREEMSLRTDGVGSDREPDLQPHRPTADHRLHG